MGRGPGEGGIDRERRGTEERGEREREEEASWGHVERRVDGEGRMER